MWYEDLIGELRIFVNCGVASKHQHFILSYPPSPHCLFETGSGSPKFSVSQELHLKLFSLTFYYFL